jgi:hypothetical protein
MQQTSDPNIYSPYHPASQTYPQEAQVYPETVRASLPAASSMPNIGSTAYGGPNAAPPYSSPNIMGPGGYPPPPLPVPKKPGSGLALRIAAVVMVVLLIVVGTVGVVFYQNVQHQKDLQTTATATTKNATVTAVAARATATASVVSGNATATATVASGNATATATVLAAHPYPTYIQGSGALALFDALQDNNQGHSWSEGDNCKFTAGSYHASQTEVNKSHYCFVKFQEFSNFTMEVQMKFSKGDCGGIFFRSNTAFTDFYVFFVCTNGQYGLYHFFANTFHALTGPGNSKFSSVIRQGSGSTNTLAVMAKGGSYTLYVNQQKIDSASDGGSSTGYNGVSVEADNVATEVIYTQATIWA